jgi:excisionase family DNA binding protein
VKNLKKLNLNPENSWGVNVKEKRSDVTFLNIGDASDFLCVQKSTLYSWVHQRRIPHRKHGRCLVFLRSDLENWSAKYAVPSRET